MATHLDDEEELQKLKTWWKENWIALVGGLVIGFGAIGGWNGYKNWRDGRLETASRMYEELKEQLAASKLDEAKALEQALHADYASTPYAGTASLAMAQDAVKRDDLDAALSSLSWVAGNADDKGMAQAARLRKARVLLAQGKHDEALSALDGTAGSFASLIDELRGDIQMAKGDRNAARSAYEKAVTAIGGDARSRVLLQQKLDDLAVDAAS